MKRLTNRFLTSLVRAIIEVIKKWRMENGYEKRGIGGFDRNYIKSKQTFPLFTDGRLTGPNKIVPKILK